MPPSLHRVLPWVLLGVIFAVELLASGNKRPESTRRDRGSFWLVQISMFTGFTLAFYCGMSGWPVPARISPFADWIALGFSAGGAALRAWAIFTLGRYFTRTVQVSSDQQVVEKGPYKLIRHPSYTGLGLMTLAVGVALDSWISIALLSVAMLVGAFWRIKVEEDALVQAIGPPYRDYMKRTKRLIPFVW